MPRMSCDSLGRKSTTGRASDTAALIAVLTRLLVDHGLISWSHSNPCAGIGGREHPDSLRRPWRVTGIAVFRHPSGPAGGGVFVAGGRLQVEGTRLRWT